MVDKFERSEARRTNALKYVPSLEERFESSYIPEPNSGCWLWTATVNRINGVVKYGAIVVACRKQKAHRVAWGLFKGTIPIGMDVLHRCDTPSCVNPKHLFIGTNLDNVADKVAKGRSSSMAGEKNPWAVLSNEKVSAIRQRLAAGGIHREIAIEFGVSRTTVTAINRGQNWK